MEPDTPPVAARVALGLGAALWAALVPGGFDVVMARPLRWPRGLPQVRPETARPAVAG